jgi:hypothetical protein
VALVERSGVKYALFVYLHESWDDLPAEERRDLHAAHRAAHEEHRGSPAATVNVLAHYRLRPREQTTAVRRVGDEIARTQGPSGAAREETLRALYLLESDDPDAVVDLAGRLPAVRIGGTAEIWPLIEPTPGARQARGDNELHP